MSTVLVFTDNKMLTKEDGISVHSVRFGFDGPRTLSFGRDIRFDEDDVFNNGDKITVTIAGTTVFTGWLLDHDPRLDTAESIEYRAIGPRGRLAQKIHTRNNSGIVVYNAEDREAAIGSTLGWTYGQIFNDLAARVPNNIITGVTGASVMSAVAPETTFTAMNVDDCMRYIVEKAGKFGFYITPSRQLRVVNLAATPSKKVYIGEIGQKVTAHPEHNVVQANLNWSIAGCKTKCTIEGARDRAEVYIRLIPAWNPNNEKYFNTAIFYGEVPATLIGANPNDIFRKYTFSARYRIRGELISGNTRITTEWFNDGGNYWFPLQAAVDLGARTVIFPTPIYNWRTYNVGTPSEITVRWGAPARLRCVLEGGRIKRTVGPIGTAYTSKGIINEIYIVDESLIRENVRRPGFASVRNDIGKMGILATQLLDAVKDEQVTGMMILDHIDLGWTLEYNVDMENTSGGKWADLNATVLSVTFNPEGTETTILQVSTSQYIGAGPDYAEIKRRLMVGQAVQTLRTKVQRMENRVSTLLGSANNPGGAQGGSDTIESASTVIDEERVKEIVQVAMNDGFFTMQIHDHTGDSQGGEAYAGKGSALL